MSKALFIAEKPSVAIEFAKALNFNTTKKNGYLESKESIITWCVGHLINMSYPEKYDKKLKRWNLKDLPFLPKEYKYEVIANVKKQFDIVKSQMIRDDVSTIYVCTDSGREGEYIYRLVDKHIGVTNKDKKRVWIDSQTEDEIRRGVKEAKSLSEYDKLSESAYLRAIEDYLIGINFSRLLTLTHGRGLSNKLGEKYTVIAVGRVMTCVLGMVVKREREIKNFIKTPYYKINSIFEFNESLKYNGEWKAVEGSKYHMSKEVFKDVGFLKKEKAQEFIKELKEHNEGLIGTILEAKRKKEKKNPPLLYNLAEIQNECSKKFKLSPDETLKIVQNLYEKKMLTYPRTDARVLSTAVAKEIGKNLKGLSNMHRVCNLNDSQLEIRDFINKIIEEGKYKGLSKTKYVNDKSITDHYAIIPTGQGLGNYNKLPEQDKKIFLLVVRRFLSIFYPPATYSKLSITTKIKDEFFFTSSKVCVDEGYLVILNDKNKKDNKVNNMETLKKLKKGQVVKITDINIKESETTPPKRYNSGAMILAMENAGKLIEDEELREQIKSQGIGTSATRSGILEKLQLIKYIKLNKKTQILTPTTKGELIYDVVRTSIPSLLKPELTASWEKGLNMIANGEINTKEYMVKLEDYIKKNTNKIIGNSYRINNPNMIISSKPKKSNSYGKCIKCKEADILQNSKAFYCANWKNGCKFTIWKSNLELYKKEITENMVKELLDNKIINDVEIVLPQTNEKCRATLEFKKDKSGALELKNVTRI